MCYSELQEVTELIPRRDAHVITMEISRADMAMLNVLRDFAHTNEIGSGQHGGSQVQVHRGCADTQA